MLLTFNKITTGNWDKISNVINKINSRLITSSNDQIFSSVFSPYVLKESKLKGITEFKLINKHE
jgi:hypothetical protein